MFYNQYTFNSFQESNPLNLSDFMMKLIEGFCYSDGNKT